MTARLQAEPGPKILVVLLEKAALLGDRGTGKLAEPAREQAHPDACRVEVDGRDHAIGPHGNPSAAAIIPQTSDTSGRRAPRSRRARAPGPPPHEPRRRYPRRRRARPPRRTPGCGHRG